MPTVLGHNWLQLGLPEEDLHPDGELIGFGDRSFLDLFVWLADQIIVAVLDRIDHRTVAAGARC